MKNKFTKEHSRDYSLFRVKIWSEVMEEDLKELVDFSTDKFCAVYRGDGLVDMYYGESVMKDLFKSVSKMCQDKEFVEKQIDNFLNIFKKLKPYYEEEKEIQDMKELKSFYKLYKKFWGPLAFIFMIPEIKNIDEDIKNKAYKAREKTQEYNKHSEKVFNKFFNKMYPNLEDDVRFVLPEEVYNEVSEDELDKKIQNRKRGFVFYKGKLYAQKPIDKILSDLGITISHSELAEIVSDQSNENHHIFEKTFSRDITFLLASSGFYNFPEAIKNSDNTLVDSPVLKQVLNGVVEFWLNQKLFNKHNELIKENLSDEKLLKRTINDYERIADEIRDSVKNLNKNSKNAFKVCELFIDFRFSNHVMFVSSMTKGWPDYIVKWSREQREKDDLWSMSDKFIRESLVSSGIETSLAKLMTLDQLKSFIETEKKPNMDKEVFVEDCTGKIYKESLENIAKKNNIKLKKESKNKNELLGQTGYKGNAKGVVKVVYTKEDLSKVEEGDILVSPMTTPDFLSAMKKASAFVTDEGGMLCHAAIVAREMQKPCVIGTKFATEVLKDGNEVEVDADNGIVKVIKK